MECNLRSNTVLYILTGTIYHVLHTFAIFAIVQTYKLFYAEKISKSPLRSTVAVRVAGLPRLESVTGAGVVSANGNVGAESLATCSGRTA
jgi:hypothetical protein